jgi:hypothetical protein
MDVWPEIDVLTPDPREYSARAGWDARTELGSPKGAQLLKALK